MLASCSIDNTVRIWDVDPAVIGTNNAQPLKVLSSHSSWVKGITWDPVGKVCLVLTGWNDGGVVFGKFGGRSKCNRLECA